MSTLLQGIPSGDEVGKQEAEDKFKAIQEAYETLFDPAKRREFDSLDEFDDSLPGEVESAEAFYTVYGQAFSRNSRWAVHQPAPTLGDDTSSYEEVRATVLCCGCWELEDVGKC